MDILVAAGLIEFSPVYLVLKHPSKRAKLGEYIHNFTIFETLIQVGDPETDHGCWERPEAMTEKRPLIQVNTSFPGTEVAAETSAAMASASLVFKSSDSTYSTTLLKHAQQLFTFADKHRGSYSESIPEVQTYYNSTGYEDELLWAASWLYHATGDKSYFEYVTGENGDDFAKFGSPTWFSWDNKLAGTQVYVYIVKH